MKIQRILFSLVLVFLFADCSYNWGQFKKYSLTVPSDLEVVGERVSGRDCGFLGSRWYSNSIAAAAREALLSAPGATGLKDVEVIAQSYQYGLWGGCIKVEGTPVREIAAPPVKPGKKK
ncbi:hypothetical protein [Leptospira stimsonii]|uniref:Lipoprotein n=1 Tax=Leptospira stimsonii TaxID=2202203 RepID=A0ABY2N5I6_9LEPT|nr:hypothetical protein [Leptospira stimsonii]TGK26911.1 hypothetical protein EHO98_00205 [Leptospira stimsonii]TGM17298.1 hypothetical protein EHQ90_07425 [Leptospira stimsonii]